MKTLTTDIKRKPKANYKIFNTKIGRYESSGSSSKTTWNSTHWVYEKLKEIQSRRGVGSMENYEIHIFPIESAIIKSAKEFIDEMKISENEKKFAKMTLENQRKKAELIRKFSLAKDEMLKLQRQIEQIDLL